MFRLVDVDLGKVVNKNTIVPVGLTCFSYGERHSVSFIRATVCEFSMLLFALLCSQCTVSACYMFIES